jgi:hypothetical protein
MISLQMDFCTSCRVLHQLRMVIKFMEVIKLAKPKQID